MVDRALALARNPALQRVAELALAAAVFFGSLADMLTPRPSSGWGGPLPLEIAAALLIAAPLPWRKRFPMTVLVLVLAGGAIDVITVAPRQAGFEPFVAMLVAYYSLGAHTAERRAVVLFAASIVFGFIPAAFFHETVGNVAPALVFAFAAWLIGIIIRSWRSRAAELEVANRKLEGQRELQAAAAVALERGRIARELHDVIAHNVSMIVVQAGAAARVLEGEEPHVRAALETIETTGRNTVDEMRRLLGVLREEGNGALLAPQPGLADLDVLVANVRDAGLPVELHVEGETRLLPSALDLTAYRIAQEALTNALKHAGPARADIVVRYGEHSVEIDVHDTGSGNGEGGCSGHGIVGMRERAALWGGRVEAGSTGNGWRVRAWLPIEA